MFPVRKKVQLPLGSMDGKEILDVGREKDAVTWESGKVNVLGNVIGLVHNTKD